MNKDDPNVIQVELVARALGELCEEFVLVGGCAAGLLVTDQSRPPVRPTEDVDLLTEVSSLGKYYKLAEVLRSRGFKEADDVICRWKIGNLLLDIMPTADILGFTNSWYPDAVFHAQRRVLPSGLNVKVITLPYFVATKIEAFYGRGNGDFDNSHDIEDIVNVLDGRPESVNDIKDSDNKVRSYIREELDQMLGEGLLINSLTRHFRPDPVSQQRIPLLIDKLRNIVGI